MPKDNCMQEKRDLIKYLFENISREGFEMSDRYKMDDMFFPGLSDEVAEHLYEKYEGVDMYQEFIIMLDPDVIQFSMGFTVDNINGDEDDEDVLYGVVHWDVSYDMKLVSISSYLY